eukprot:1246022-Pyramimonas_sp.AAC.1
MQEGADRQTERRLWARRTRHPRPWTTPSGPQGGHSALATRVPRGPFCPYCHQHFFPWTTTDCGQTHEEWGAQARHNRLQPG